MGGVRMSGEPDYPEEARRALPADEAELLGLLCEFTDRRLEAAGRERERIERLAAEAELAAALHAFLREAWEALDGLAREVNLVMHHVRPDAGLEPPLQMSRQCTLYTVRLSLREGPAADHPVSRLLWDGTREEAPAGYRRLSFLYNLSRFVPLPLPEGGLPGAQDVPPCLQALVRPAEVDRCDPREGTGEVLDWLRGFIADARALLARSMP